MKSRLLTLAAAGMMLASCQNAQMSSGPSLAQKNIDAVHVVNNAFETGDVSHIDDVVAADFVDHTEKGDLGRDSLKAYIRKLHASGISMKMEVVKDVADSNYVFSMMHYSGVGDGMLMPKGPFDVHAVEVVRFQNGKGVEHWSFVNGVEMMKMMGQMQAAPKTDSAGKH